mmetsp:Transcript_34797/g.59099  ORF Transcript_34797/g.59099 Transcript_34797/m.59099 type:complete len:165 (-) Transcript_34797:135-629(-)
MTTRTFPIFRSLQRAIGGSVGVSKSEPALSATAQIFEGKSEETKQEEREKGAEENGFDDGHELGTLVEDGDGFIIDKPSTWPINSEKARQLRRSFVQEGFRRLYNAASGQTNIVGAGDGIYNNGENEVNEVSGETEQYAENNENEAPPAIAVPSGTQDWMYYAQ